MLGHQLYNHLKDRHETRVTLRQKISVYKKFNMFSHRNSYAGIDVTVDSSIERSL